MHRVELRAKGRDERRLSAGTRPSSGLITGAAPSVRRIALEAGALLFVLTWAATGVAAESDPSLTRNQMRSIYASLSVLLPLSVDDEAFRDAKEREKVRLALANLANRAETVGRHSAGEDRRLQYLAGSLSRETRLAMSRFDEGAYDGARFLVRRLTDFCVACHTRTPSLADSPVARGFVDRADIAELSPDRRATIQIATRQFDDALETLEGLFLSTSVSPPALLEPLTSYLRVAIRVKGDLERARGTLRRFLSRGDLWANLRGDVEGWLVALDREAALPAGPASIASAKTLLEEAQQVMRYPSDRRGLIQQLLASSKLHRYLEKRSGESGRDVAEAYYLLGQIETRTNLRDLASEGEFYLETAIRLAPGDTIGEQAFALLEERTILGWSGSSGDHMPADVRSRLEALRALVEAN